MDKLFCTFLFYLTLISVGWSLAGYFTPLADQDSCQPAGNASRSTVNGPHTTREHTRLSPVILSLPPAVGMQDETWLSRRLCSVMGVSGFLLVLALNVGYDLLH